MAEHEIIKLAEQKMQRILEQFQEELKTVRTGRPNPEVFKKIKVSCYGSLMSLSDIATITVPDGRSFMIQPFDKANLKAIEGAISESDLGFNPSNDGSALRINVPPLSEDRRNELVRFVAKQTEEMAKVPIRGIRQDLREKIKKLPKEGISEDDLKKMQDQLEKITAKFIVQADELLKKKEQELMKV